jgi:hypothetical protein
VSVSHLLKNCKLIRTSKYNPLLCL